MPSQRAGERKATNFAASLPAPGTEAHTVDTHDAKLVGVGNDKYLNSVGTGSRTAPTGNIHTESLQAIPWGEEKAARRMEAARDGMNQQDYQDALNRAAEAT